ncbi:MAG: ATP-binding cassette domain-containing protein [Porphyromonas somerae]|uniref:ABC transporter ATP-binding protein n=1 Tax=Porphyromonas somerae TaxID=322095 RepID=UPI0026ED40C7|nr:ATP-binding cassette domain-containing protein [Porphyromonas somerae]MDD7557341.1 ATP-binding cassette domain-containing protein [Porphyromonas somerae]MDY3119758.1 ATP-binding cassette domain-containing protein [Porphyromonas somerae]MDY3884367.1 ATP-binding cassette domain-containing protein [Porphyromonas somerae]MDY5815241.1 ATP-binding cassette domain-containing protein [Porphyromonas somerae]
MIEVRDLHMSFGQKEVLKGVNATFNPGECSLIIGKSGVGKTVLMKCIIGLLEPTKGRVLYDDIELQTLSPEETRQLRQKVGMLFQNSALFDSMNVMDNVLYPLDMFSNEKGASRRARAKECLERVQLYDARYKYPGEISGGMKKRVAIARAIALRPRYLFCDEPTSGLDPETSKMIDILLREITLEDQMTTIVNTHDMNSVANIGDHVLFVHDGNIWWEGKGKDIEKSDDEVLKNFVFISKL